MKTIQNPLLILCIGLACSHSFCQNPRPIQDSLVREGSQTVRSGEKVFDFFSSTGVLEMSLCFDIKELLKSKNQPEYFDATLTVKKNESDSVTRHIKLKVRGNMRLSYCSFPPILLKFDKADCDSEYFQGRKTLKLVTQCYQTSQFEKYLLKEYLVYQLFNLVTPFSFRTRLVKIHYIDSHPSGNDFTEYGFLIENDDEVARRNNAVVMNNITVTQKHMNTQDMARVAVFNFMIGNTDWAVPNQHNIKVLKSLDVQSEKGIPVAFDFDYSGFVNTTYSAPADGLPITTVRERYYMGICYAQDELGPVLEEFSSLQEKFRDVIDNFQFLSGGDKKQIEAYMNTFYKMYKYQDGPMNDMNRTCQRF